MRVCTVFQDNGLHVFLQNQTTLATKRSVWPSRRVKTWIYMAWVKVTFLMSISANWLGGIHVQIKENSIDIILPCTCRQWKHLAILSVISLSAAEPASLVGGTWAGFWPSGARGGEGRMDNSDPNVDPWLHSYRQRWWGKTWMSSRCESWIKSHVNVWTCGFTVKVCAINL